MRIAELTYLLSARGGGVPPVVAALADAYRAAGQEVDVLGVRDAAQAICPAAVFPPVGPLALGLAPGIGRALRRRRHDVLHLHSLFTWPSHDAHAWGRRTGGPVVITPHGCLEPMALARSAWKKRAFRWLVEDANLRDARCLHALREGEAENFRRLGLRNPVAIVPNGVDLPSEDAISGDRFFAERFPLAAERKVMLFLGRVHPQKGLANLVGAWRDLLSDSPNVSKDWVLAIAGPDQLGHAAELASMVRDLGLERDVLLPGPLYGPEKHRALSSSGAFVLPSFFEGFSMALLEAMAYRLPSLVTRQCNFDVGAHGAGLLCEPTRADVTRMLKAFFSHSPGELSAMGERGRALVASRYTWTNVAANLLRVYEWLLGGGPPPEAIWDAGR